MEQIAAAKIKVYEFPEVEDGEEAERKENRRMKVGWPESKKKVDLIDLEDLVESREIVEQEDEVRTGAEDALCKITLFIWKSS